MLALSFLLLVGVMLIAEGFDHKVPKGYIYFAMAFSVAVEMLNIRMRQEEQRAGQAARAIREELDAHTLETARARATYCDARFAARGEGEMVFALLRLAGVIWIFGFIVLALVATSSYLYSTETAPERTQRWQTRLRMALMWPIALMSSAGRARLRRG